MTRINAPRLMRILLAEDSEADVRLTQEALKEGQIRSELTVARDGEEALAVLRSGAALPDLILLDLNMPRKDGREVLAELKADPDLQRIPVVVLSTSSSELDVERSYDLHANCFITKPVDFDRFMTVVRSIEDFWLTVVRLPSRCGESA